MEKEDSFPQHARQIVTTIPEDYVTTYGDAAKLTGSPHAARQVDGMLKHLSEGNTLLWHRVVDRHDTISLTGLGLQRRRQTLLAEGAMMLGSGQIDLQLYRWDYQPFPGGEG